MQQPNKELFVRVMNHIITHPETWNQGNWHCGTQHCFAGHAQVMYFGTDSGSTEEEAMEALKICQDLARWLFNANRGLLEMYECVRSIVSGEINSEGCSTKFGYISDPGFVLKLTDHWPKVNHNPNGYDQYGYDWMDYNRQGYTPEGEDESGRRIKLALLEVPKESDNATTK